MLPTADFPSLRPSLTGFENLPILQLSLLHFIIYVNPQMQVHVTDFTGSSKLALYPLPALRVTRRPERDGKQSWRATYQSRLRTSDTMRGQPCAWSLLREKLGSSKAVGNLHNLEGRQELRRTIHHHQRECRIVEWIELIGLCFLGIRGASVTQYERLSGT